jgi:hypothetical protein
MACTGISTDGSMREIGLKTSSMGSARKRGRTIRTTKVTLAKENETDMEF